MTKKLEGIKANILIVGACGAGKSSLLNAIFDEELALIGEDASPQTYMIAKYQLENGPFFYDTPGLGDSQMNDLEYKEDLKELFKSCQIDLAILLLEPKKDLYTSRDLLENLLLKYLSKEQIIIAVGKSDRFALQFGELSEAEFMSSIKKRLLKDARPIKLSTKAKDGLFELENAILQRLGAALDPGLLDPEDEDVIFADEVATPDGDAATSQGNTAANSSSEAFDGDAALKAAPNDTAPGFESTKEEAEEVDDFTKADGIIAIISFFIAAFMAYAAWGQSGLLLAAFSFVMPLLGGFCLIIYAQLRRDFLKGEDVRDTAYFSMMLAVFLYIFALGFIYMDFKTAFGVGATWAGLGFLYSYIDFKLLKKRLKEDSDE